MVFFKPLSLGIAGILLLFLYTNCGGPVHVEGTGDSSSLVSPPAAPSALSASSAAATQIDLTWTDNSSDEAGFYLERSASAAGPFSQVATIAADTTAHQDTGLSANTTYYYRLAAYNYGGVSAFTATVSATTTPVAVTPPAAPTALVANAVSGTEIALTWNDNSNDESGFKIERATVSGGPFTQVAQANAGLETYTDSGLAPSTTYYYRIRATNSAGDSAYAPAASATTLEPAPAPPAGLTAAAASASQITLTWIDGSVSETGFRIARATNSAGPFTFVGTVGANQTSFTDNGLSTATAYYYRVHSYSASGNSAPSNTATAVTFGTYSWFNTNINQPKCLSCHSGSRPSANYDMSTYAKVMTAVVPGNANASLLYTDCANGSMPKGGAKLTTAQLTALRTWINSGAANN